MARPVRQFVDGRFGQIHVRVATPVSAPVATSVAAPVTARKRPLACLHMSPKSGRIFTRFMAQASGERVVLAHDYPGFGESDPPPGDPVVTIEDYAQSLWDVVDALQLGTIDLFGYHTGSLVAAEAARQRPDQVGAIVMISAPVFTAEELAQMQATYAEIPLDAAGTRFRRMWDSVIAHRGPGVTLAMLAESYAENFRAGEHYEWGHRAAFAYAPKFAEVVGGLSQRITVLMPDDDLAAHTLRIGPWLADGEIISHPEWGHGFLDAHTDAAVAAVASALDGG